MNFFKNNIHPKNILKKPHKWLVAFLCSPIHLLETHYKNTYHLNFSHAKKLFIFDMTLLLATIFLAFTALFWFTYDPTVTSLVYIKIEPSQTRVISGEYIEYNITYKNASTEKLILPVLNISLPPGFVLNEAQPRDIFNDNYFTLETINPGETGDVLVAGWIYGTPEIEIPINVSLSYKQEDRKKFEEKASVFIKTLRGSVLQTKISSRNMVLTKDSLPLTLNLENTGEELLKNILIPLTKEVEWQDITTTLGAVENDAWYITELPSGQTAKLTSKIVLDLPNKEILNIAITPEITVNNISIPQETENKELTIVHPKANLGVYWQTDTAHIKPNEIADLFINIKNIGNVTLTNPKIEMPIPASIVNPTTLASLNKGYYANGIFTKNLDKNLLPNEETVLTIKVPIVYYPQGGNDLTLHLTPKLTATVAEIQNSNYNNSSESNSIKIGTQLLFNTEIRYYTAEGDQLGRGPLPPQVGKETKYWCFINLTNGASKTTDLQLTGSLPAGISWADKSSVSHGADVTYKNGNFSWSANNLPAYGKAGIYFELSVTPQTDQIGKSPILIESINLTATDSYTGEIITHSSQNLDISLPNDSIGQNKGVIVQ